jgi:group I intron endonuclease
MNRRLKLIGIYCITCLFTNRKYIGSSTDITARWNTHITCLLYGKHSNKDLQADFNKYGLSNYNFTVLVVAKYNITKQNLLILEQLEIDMVPRMNLYNTKRAIAKKTCKLK